MHYFHITSFNVFSAGYNLALKLLRFTYKSYLDGVRLTLSYVKIKKKEVEDEEAEVSPWRRRYTRPLKLTIFSLSKCHQL